MATTPHRYAELEIACRRAQTESWEVELRYTDPDSEAEIPPEKGLAGFDLAELLALHHDPAAYGETLAAQLFHDEPVRALYLQARAAAEARDLDLRLRLRIEPSAPELHALRWELLADPRTRAPLATSEKTLLSRFMLSRDWRTVKIRPKAELCALVAVSAPTNLARYQLAEVDREGEIARARTGLGAIRVTVAGQDEPLTLEHLVAALRRGVDILYLVCHGALSRRGVSMLYLQDEAGEVALVEGEKLAQRIAELAQAPRLAVLASCQSAGREEGGDVGERSAAQAALAPRLAEAGVPAILAMQGKISMATIERAMPIFFSELGKDGQIDRALAVARAAVRERPDAWMPALYLRLRQGRIWYVPGFAGEDGDFSKWRSIVSSVRHGSFIPIVGADLGEHVFGTTRELADRLAESHGFPLAAHDRTDLPKVIQFLTVDESKQYARDELLALLHRQVVERYPALAASAKTSSLPKLLDAVVAAQTEDDPLRILAELPASIYVTTSTDPLLLKTLKAQGREPVPLLCDWHPSPDNHPREPAYDEEPVRQKPIVYHVFGVLGKPGSMVLAEDDFFDYLIATADYKLVPTAVRGALIRSSLLFLGFRLDDWTFRVLFRLIMTLAGSHHLRELAHVGVQIDPEDHTLADVERARKYLESYFSTGTDTPPISIFWGSAADFLRQLRLELAKTSGEEPVTPVEEDEDDWLG